MKYFADTIIHPLIARQGYRTFCEIGASYGENTDRLLEIPAARITIVDPCLDADLAAKYKDRGNVQVHRGLSLDVLKEPIETFDCILIDGDHNWYTVFNELDLIAKHQLLKPGGTIFLHDVGWPYGRRDLYYQPHTIPAAFLQPHAQKGIVRGQVLLSETGGNNAGRENALRSGGPRNGVLTAVEDFLAEHPREYWFVMDREQHGLGVMFRRKAGGDNGLFIALWLKVLVRSLRRFVRSRRGKIVTAAALFVLARALARLLSTRGKRR
jgi:SAM-dependent methyltransferase